MSSSNPMSLIFNTQLDNKEFERGASDLQKALQSLRKKVLELAGVMNSAFDLVGKDSGKTAIGTFQDMKEDAEEITGLMENFDIAKTYIQQKDAIEILNKALDGFAKRMYTLEDGTVMIGQQTEQYLALAKVINLLEMNFEMSSDAQNKAAKAGIEDIEYFRKKFSETLESLNFAETYQEAGAVFKELQSQMREFADLEYDPEKIVAKDLYKKTISEMAKTVDELENRMNGIAHSRSWTDMEEHWKKMPTLSGYAKKAFDSVKGMLKGMADAVKGAFGNVAEGVAKKATEASFGLKKITENLPEAFDKLGGSIASLAGGGIKTAMTALGGLAAKALGAAKNISMIAGTKAVTFMRDFSIKAFEAAKNLGIMAASKTVNFLKNLGIQALSTAKNLAMTASGNIVKGFHRLSSAMTGAGRQAKAFGQKASISFRQVLGYAIGLASLSQIFTKLKGAISQGFSKLMEADPELKKTVEGLKESVEQLKVSFAAAFLPLVQIVVPVIQRIINALAQGISYIGQFVAAMTGSDVYKQAVKNQKALAGAAGNTASAYGDAADAAEKQKKTIASFDEVHILDKEDKQPEYNLNNAPVSSEISDLADKLKEMWKLADFTELGRRVGQGLKKLLDSIPWDKIKEVAGKLGKSIATFMNGFMEVPGLFSKIGETLAQAINTIFELLNAFVSNLHWDSLGKAFKDFVTGLLDNIDWDLIHDTFAKLGKGIGTALENAFNNPKIWTSIFTSISNAVKALLLLLYNLFTTPDWKSIGGNIGTGLNKGIEEFPWSLLSQTIAAGVNGFFSFVSGLFASFDSAVLGRHIAQSLTETITAIDWENISGTISGGINELFSFLLSLVTGIPWADIGTTIRDFVVNALTTIDWTTIYSTFYRLGAGIGKTVDSSINNPEIWTAVFETLAKKLNALISLALGFFNNTDWGSIAGNVGTGLNAGIEAINWTGLSHVVSGGLNAVFSAAYSFVTTFDFLKFGQHIGEAITEAVGNTDWATGAAAFAGAINGLFDFLNGLLSETDFGLLGRSVFEAIGGFFAELDMTKWGEFLSNVWIALFDFLTEAFRQVDWKALPGQIFGLIGDFMKGFKWDEFATAAMNYLGIALGAAITTSVSLLTTAGGAIYKAFGNIVKGGLQGIIDALKGIKDWVVDHVFTPFINGFKAAFDIGSPSKKMEPLGRNIIEGMGKGIISWITGIPGWLSEHVGAPLIGGVKKLFGIDNGEPALEGPGIKTIEGLKNGMVNALGDAAGWVDQNIVSKITGPVMDKLGLRGSESEVFNSYGSQVANGLKSGIQSGADGMKDVVDKNLTGSVLGPIEEGFGISGTDSQKLKDYGNYLTASMTTGISNGLSAVVTMAESLTQMMMSKFNETDWTSVGTNLCDGIYNGLNNSWEWLKNTVDNLASSLYEAACSALGISSPSKVFKTVGANVTAGLAQGIEETKEEAGTSAKNLAQTVVSGAEKLADMQRIGINLVGGLNKGIKDAAGSLTDCVRQMLTESVKNEISTGFGTDGTPFTQDEGKKVAEGLKSGITGGMEGIGDVLSNYIFGPVLNGIAAGLGTDGTPHTREDGLKLIEALREGMLEKAEGIGELVNSSIASPVVSAVMERFGISTGSEGSSEFSSIGQQVSRSLIDGIKGDWNSLSSEVTGFIQNIRGLFEAVDWSAVGGYILEGIENGLNNGWDWIYSKVTEIANSLLEAACSALGISSPSKEFKWVGEMITNGLTGGIEDTQQNAVRTAEKLAEAVIEGASGADPTIDLKAGVDGLDGVLTTFSDKVTEGFANMVERMESIVSGASFYMPATATGTVLPFAARNDSGDLEEDTLTQILDRLTTANFTRMTRSDFQEILERVFREYMNISFYMGDEQVARHANAGNEQIERRYRAVASG